MKIIDVRDGATEDAARERHELATARAAIAHADRVLENGRLAEVERERDYRVDECTRLAARVRELVSERDAALAEVDCGQEGVCAKPPGCAKHWQERNQELVAERDAALASSRAWCEKAVELQVERDGYKVSARRLRLTANTQERLLGRLRAERDSAVARAKDLEAALENAMGTFLGIYNSCVVSLDGPGPHALSNSIRPRAKSAACKLGEALHPPPPASASDRTGTEHHDAADPEDGCQAGARRP